jgi:hypothetical protein
MALRAASGWKPGAGGDFKIEPPCHMDVSLELQRAADLVIEAGLHAAELTDEADGRGERSREYFGRLTELFDLYTSPENLIDGSPQYPLPAIVGKQLGSLCKYLSAGIIPGPIKHCARRGRQLGPDEGRDVMYAVIYVLAAKQRQIPDRHPIKTIVERYGLSDRRTVQTWIVKHQKAAAPKSSADPDLIKDRMMEAAQRYRVSGRQQDAVRNRASKRSRASRKTAASRCESK